MKKILAISVIGLLLVVGMALAAYTGGGRVLSITKIPNVVTGFTADVVSVYNAGADLAWVMINATGPTVSNAAVAATAIPIPANMSYTFDQRDKQQAHGMLTSVAVVTTNTAATVYVSWY